MPKEIKLRKGFDIKLVGKAEKNVVTGIHPDTYAFKPTDFLGIARPKVMVNPGDLVKAGTPIFFDKMNPAVRFTAPVSGEVVEVKRGDKRAPLEIVILADKEIEYLSFNKYTSSALSSLSAEDAKAQMLESGVWPHIIQRPFGVIANPEQSPKAIFISTFDTHPVAPDYAFALKGEEQERARLAKDLHDGLGGMLSGIKYSLSTVKGNLVMTPDNAQAFERSLDMLDNSIREMRRVAHNMMPEVLLRYGLQAALKDHCAEINKSGIVRIIFDQMGDENNLLEPSARLAIYRIGQEL